MSEPSYLRLYRSGELRARVEAALALQTPSCRLCPHLCGVNRAAGEQGLCRTGLQPVVASVGAHFGEEAMLVGQYGSGAIFLGNCNLDCLFCQNYDISHRGAGEELTVHQLAQHMLSLQGYGCHNINLVTPTHQVPQLLSALEVAIAGGLTLPLVWNCGGYERVESLQLLDGIVDIYMPDAKYGSNASGKVLSGARDYWDRSREALKEMHRQVGDLQLDERGLARRGLIVRHLVLPEELAATREVMRFLAQEISPHTFVNLMDQYRPAWKVVGHSTLGRRLRPREYEEAINIAREEGLRRFAD